MTCLRGHGAIAESPAHFMFVCSFRFARNMSHISHPQQHDEANLVSDAQRVTARRYWLQMKVSVRYRTQGHLYYWPLIFSAPLRMSIASAVVINTLTHASAGQVPLGHCRENGIAATLTINYVLAIDANCIDNPSGSRQ